MTLVGCQKQSPRGVLWKRCSWKLRKIHKKTPVSEVFCKKSVPENFAKFTGKQLCPFLIKCIKYSFNNTRCFAVDFAKFLRTLFYRTTPVAATSTASDTSTLALTINLLQIKLWNTNSPICISPNEWRNLLIKWSRDM